LGKRKLHFFDEIKTFEHVLEFDHDENLLNSIAGKWNTDRFKNSNPIILELACGKGEYTNALAERHPNINFIGVDIKGDRIHRGAKRALQNDLTNVQFIRSEIQFLPRYFAENEVDEIWITFPDPHLRGKRRDNRLTSQKYCEIYKKFLKPEGVVHLKTDSQTLFLFTRFTLLENQHSILVSTDDLYNDNSIDSSLKEIQTYYEKKYLRLGKNITYIKFRLR
jgi:tRNA (guanine-N7-)-methyltransferase